MTSQKLAFPCLHGFWFPNFFIVYSKRHSNKDEKKLEQSPGGLAAFFDFFSEQTKMAAKFRKAIAIGQKPKNTLLPTYLQTYNHTKTVTKKEHSNWIMLRHRLDSDGGSTLNMCR